MPNRDVVSIHVACNHTCKRADHALARLHKVIVTVAL